MIIGMTPIAKEFFAEEFLANPGIVEIAQGQNEDVVCHFTICHESERDDTWIYRRQMRIRPFFMRSSQDVTTLLKSVIITG